MPNPNTVCRVCGKEYFCCSDSRKINSWRTMACSGECFKEYMRLIEISRSTEEPQKTKSASKKKSNAKANKVTRSDVKTKNIEE